MNYSIARKNNSGAIAWSEEQVRYIITEYQNNNQTLKSLSQEFNVQPQSIRNLLRRQKIEITSKKTINYPRKSNYFKEINSREKAYWLGMMLSDGSVTNNYSINLGLKDKEHIEKFQKALGAFNHKIIEIQDNRWSKPCINYRISIKDKQLANDLAKYNCVPNKSYIEFDFPNILELYYYDFIRGYFDGDGSIYFSNSNNKFIIDFTGNKQFLNTLKKILNKDNLSLCQNIKSKQTYNLKIGGKKDVQRILHLMYDNSTEDTRLDRKFKIVQQVISF